MCIRDSLHTKRNEYDSIIKPLMVWMEGKGVKFQYGCAVYDLDMNEAGNTVHGIRAKQKGTDITIPVAAEDYVFLTNGSLMIKEMCIRDRERRCARRKKPIGCHATLSPAVHSMGYDRLISKGSRGAA